MKITCDEVLKEKQWLNAELSHSLTPDLIDQAIKLGYYEVKLIVNGVELEPQLFNDIVNGIEMYIKKEANSIVAEELYQAKYKINRLEQLIEEAAYKIREEFDIKEEDY
jgi:hypothetical protein